MLLLAILGVMSGCQGYRALEDFGIRHGQKLCEVLGLDLRRMPSDTTMRRMLRRVNFEQLTEQFNTWATEQYAPQAGEWVAVDGKSIKGTVQDSQERWQNFVSVVSVYSHQQRVVIAQKSFENKGQSEIQVVEQLLAQLELTQVVVSMDALHCQKKTVERLVAQGNDYLIAVKGNQPKLMQQFQSACAEMTPHSQTVELDNSHGRQVERTTRVFAAPPALATTWPQARSLVVVERQGTREGQTFATISYYLTSLNLSAMAAALGVRQHRDIENGLHWVKDVVFGEDAAPFPHFSPALNWSVIRSIALNLFRSHGYHSLTTAIRLLGHDLLQLLALLTSPAPVAP
jgi:predicted transposase YbfD/YdcC